MTRKHADPPDFAALAQQYLDLWEDQIAAMAANPDLAEQTSRFFDALGRFGTAANPMAAAGIAETMRAMAASPHGRGDDGAASPGPAAAGAADRDGDRRLDELARRLGELETRLARLESGAGAARTGAGGGAGRRAGSRGKGKPAAGTKPAGGKRRRPAAD